MKPSAGSARLGIYGKELILDLHDCDASRFTRSSIDQFCAGLCDLIDMERYDLHFWDDVGVAEDERQTNPKDQGDKRSPVHPYEHDCDPHARSHEDGVRKRILV